MSSTPFAMRRATPADREAVVALSRAVNPDDFIAHVYDFWMGGDGPDGLYLAEQEGRLVGCYALEFHGPGQAYFLAMRIHPEAQGKGIGSLFCRAQVEQALSVGAEDIYLFSVLDNQRAHRTVAKNGFVNRGAWLVYDAVKELPASLPTGGARWATAADAEAIARFRQERSDGALDGVIASPYTGWAIRTEEPGEWDLAQTALVEGADGLAGVMLLRPSEEDLLVRWLDGSPAAVADLLGLACAQRGELPLSLSLPLAREPLLAPLGLDPEAAFRAYVFHFPRGAQLPDLDA